MINMTLSRLIALEREQIGLLKALGYGRWRIAAHYFKMSLSITAVGIAIGFVAGTWLGHGLTVMYANFFHFPFLIFNRGWDIYVISAGVTAFAAVAGAAKAVYSVVTLPPAVAMSPPAPTQYAHIGIERLAVFKLYTQLTMMALRHMIRWPVRTGFTILGVALSVSLLITSFFMIDSVEFMIDATFFRSDRQDATVTFTDERPFRVLQDVERLPGVLRAEPIRSTPARLRHGHLHRKLAIQGKPPGADLSRVLDLDLNPVVLADSGLILGEKVADLLNVRVGDDVEIEVLEGKRVKRTMPVSQIIQSYLGLSVFMDLDTLNEMLDESPSVSSVHIAYDTAMLEELFTAIKGLPAVSAIASQRAALAKFRETLAQNIYIMTAVYITLSVIIAFGVVYNSARIQLSERAREFASLRVLGFTKAEVSRVMMTELVILILIASPLGCIIGYGFAKLVIVSFESDLYRIPFVISSNTYAFSSLVVMAAAIVSALIVRRGIDRLDLIKALKTRE
jgi:putative ABC transport system permease protein